MNSNDNAPNASKLIESLRFVGYNNYSAIADLVDNSIDALAGFVKIEIGQSGDGFLVTITDNGTGMDVDTLDQALRLGSNTVKDAKSDLGKYGLGLITASISFARKLTVVTRKDGHYLTAVHDLDEVVRTNKFIRTIRTSTDKEKNFFIDKTGGSMSGTILILGGVDRLQNTNLSVFRSTLTAHLGQTFRYYIIAGKRIFIQGKEVHARDPLMLEHPETDLLSEQEHEFKLEDGTTETIRLLIVCLPKFSEKEQDALKINMRNQGFYVMRNLREIAGGETLGGIFTKHNSLNRFRAEVHITGHMDTELGTSFTKDEIKITDAMRSWIEKVSYPQIQTVRDRSGKQKSQDIARRVDHASSERVFKNRAKLLPTRPTKETDESSHKDWRQKHTDEVSFVTEQHGRLAPLFTHHSLGRKTVITYNADHPFYVQVFEQIGDNKDLTNAIDFLSYSIAAGLSRITTEKSSEQVDNFMSTFSDNLRTLLGN